jgi:uncharacterized GH25 family protein
MKLKIMAFALTAVAVMSYTSQVAAHEMFLKAEGSSTPANSTQVVRLINGTFDKSENSITRDRMNDVTVIGDGKVFHPPVSSWSDDAKKTYSSLTFKTGDPGTYVVGISTKPSIIELSAADWVTYLKHDGVVDTLAVFEKENKLAKVRERYSKHVRTIIQVGDKKTPDYAKTLGYPVEIILDQNPYSLKFGDNISFRVLYKGKPAANQVVRASYEGFHGHDAAGGHINSYNLRTDNDGRASFLLNNKALWYISLIHMEKVNEAAADYESNWATLTFQVK